MARADEFDPVGNGEIAEMIGESKQLARYLMNRPGAPEPVIRARGKVWPRATVIKYMRSLGREVTA